MSIDVVNSGQVIDGVSARVIGLPEHCVDAQPALLPLFPDTSGRLTISLAVPPTLPAGRHPLTVEVVSHGAQLPSQFLDVDLDVSSRPAMGLAAQPRIIRARRGARFLLELTNEGNIGLDVALTAVDSDRAVRSELQPATLHLEAGAVAPVLLSVRGPRMLTGAEIDRTVTVQAVAHTADRAQPDAAVRPEVETTRETTIRLRQRPLVSRGVLTALILASIVLLWAGVFLLGLTKVFTSDPMTKQAPASFFLPAGHGGAGGSANGATNAAANAAAPADALPKTGQLPPGTGGTISGTVTSANDHQPVGRILVQAMRVTPSGLRLVSSAATQTDGTYSLGGLFPTSYYIKFTASGFRTVWYPTAPALAGAQQVGAQAQGVTTGVDTIITGRPASISGKVDPGDSLTPVRTTVTARPLLGAAVPAHAATTTTAADGSYHLTGLPAPGSYELTFTTAGYRTSTLSDTVNGGDARLEPTITLGASNGSIAGTVTDGSKPLGGATISTTVNGKPMTVSSPTTGQVGAYVLGGLPTPGTYVVTFTAPGHSSETKIIDLAAGQAAARADVNLGSGTGSVTGRLTDELGHGLGGATVTVGGSAVDPAGTPPKTVTLTSGGLVGTFLLNGLTAPGSYTLTFSLSGYVPVSVPVTLRASGGPAVVNAVLQPAGGKITGTVRGPSGDLQGAAITATDGRKTWTTTSTSSGFVIPGLMPGHYSVTATYSGLTQQTALVTVGPRSSSSVSLTLKAGG